MHKLYTLKMARLRLQVVLNDRFYKVFSEQLFDGLIVITEPFEHARYHSGAFWPASV